MFHHVINYQNFSIPFVIIRVALQEYLEYTNLSYGISVTTKYYNKCLKYSVLQPTHFSYYSFNATLMVTTKVIDKRW
jgi:hypothetical protein